MGGDRLNAALMQAETYDPPVNVLGDLDEVLLDEAAGGKGRTLMVYKQVGG